MRPIHPAIVHLPIALMTFSVVVDLVGYLTDSSIFQAAGFLALLGTGIGAGIAIITGLIDKSRSSVGGEASREAIRFHMQVGFGLFVAIVVLTLWRWVVTLDPHHLAGWIYLGPAFVVLAVTLLQGWLGAELVFSWGIGVSRSGKGTEPPPETKEG